MEVCLHSMYEFCQRIPHALNTNVCYSIMDGHCVAGAILSKMLSAWLYAFYCFDYNWSLHNVPLSRKNAQFAKFWIYYIGFGLPMVSVGPHHSWVARAAFMACMFSIGIVQCVGANPLPAAEKSTQNYIHALSIQ